MPWPLSINFTIFTAHIQINLGNSILSNLQDSFVETNFIDKSDHSFTTENMHFKAQRQQNMISSLIFVFHDIIIVYVQNNSPAIFLLIYEVIWVCRVFINIGLQNYTKGGTIHVHTFWCTCRRNGFCIPKWDTLRLCFAPFWRVWLSKVTCIDCMISYYERVFLYLCTYLVLHCSNSLLTIPPSQSPSGNRSHCKKSGHFSL